MNGFQRFSRWYKGAALLLLNTLVLFIIVNVVLWSVMGVWHHVKEAKGSFHGYPAADLRKVYPNLTDDQRTQLLTEVWNRPFVYQQFVEFQERPIQGQYVTVNDSGYRVSPAQGPWPIDPKNRNVFIFGGSTTFGYGVADDQTIPYYLQQLFNDKTAGRRTCVYNFAQGFYYSTQERIQFEQMLQSGVKPDVAVFIDGLNDFFHATGVLPFTPQLKKAMDPDYETLRHAAQILQSLPISRALAHLGKPPAVQEDVPAMVAAVVQHYVWNKQAIEAVAKANGVPVSFVFQPVPQYHYDLQYHLFVGDDWTQHRFALAGYPVMATYTAEHPMGDDFLWLGDMQVRVKKPLYVDQVHYTPEFSHDIAVKIFDFLTRAPAAG